MLKVKDLTAGYLSTKVIEAINFEVKPGELLGLLGPNGAGKTTILRAIQGIMPWHKGQVWIGSRNLSGIGWEERGRLMSSVPQQNTIPFELTVEELVSLGRIPYQKAWKFQKEEDSRIIKEAMLLTNIKHMKYKLTNQVSGGEFQRVMIAKSLAQQPRIWLLDEPTLHLDVHYQEELMSLIKNLVRRMKIAGVVVFHDFRSAKQYCDQVVLLDKGRIISKGEPGKILSKTNIQKVFVSHNN
jgi:iron complex transport system ATP-binding protein